jgi:hypothetical protein
MLRTTSAMLWSNALTLTDKASIWPALPVGESTEAHAHGSTEHDDHAGKSKHQSHTHGIAKTHCDLQGLCLEK